jgi:hypothetical protein
MRPYPLKVTVLRTISRITALAFGCSALIAACSSTGNSGSPSPDGLAGASASSAGTPALGQAAGAFSGGGTSAGTSSGGAAATGAVAGETEHSSGGTAGGGANAGGAGAGGAVSTSGGVGSGGAATGGGSAGTSSVPFPTCAKTACTTCGSSGHLHNLANDVWAGSLTLFISYSSDTRSQTVDKGFTAAQWNAAVNSFDVASFAKQVQATGAKNILLMLGQNTGYYCSPNSAYEKYAGVDPNTRASKRDLPMEIADALLPLGIGLFLYLPEDVGWGDKKAAAGFGLSALALDNWVVDSGFTPKWNAVVKEWSDRYRTKVRGWFFDGYDSRWGVSTAMAQTYRNTVLAANPCGIATFNGANGNGLSDTERGETRIDAATGLPAKGLPSSRWTSSDIQTMWAFPLQAAWGQEIEDNSPAIYSNANLKKFVAAAVKAQTVFALDVRTSFTGKLSTPVYQQLLAIQ